MTQGKIFGRSNFKNFASNKIGFLKILKIHEFFLNQSNFFVFVLQYTHYKEKMFTIEKEDGAKHPAESLFLVKSVKYCKNPPTEKMHI